MKQYIFAMLIIIFTSSKLTYASSPSSNNPEDTDFLKWAELFLIHSDDQGDSSECDHRYNYERVNESHQPTNCIYCDAPHPSQKGYGRKDVLRRSARVSRSSPETCPKCGKKGWAGRRDNYKRHLTKCKPS